MHTLCSSALSSCHNRVYQSLANLIRWSDQVMLDGIDLEDKENVVAVTTVIKAVLDGVKVSPLPSPNPLPTPYLLIKEIYWLKTTLRPPPMRNVKFHAPLIGSGIHLASQL